ncbi:radical SAM/SPASM domain-containing protein [Kitasatospora sp. NPDC004614]|uniref:radical SAM/SPASM domain-containing protein n=1 Tax=unclassified Kitasatospora TaxID=2633591 RepID=UPI003676C8F6
MKTENPSEVPIRRERKPVDVGLDFLWLELTNRCNLQCVHCYTESGPQTGDSDRLTADDYLSVMTQAYALGCRKMQFIGGEPMLNPDFQRLLEASKEIGFEFIEVFTNLTHLDEKTLQFARSAKIHFATSVYSENPELHGAVTRNRASHARTIGNLKRLIENGIETRAAVLCINQELSDIENTKRFLTRLGVRRVRSSYVRAFGRGEDLGSRPSNMSELCGHCWAGRLCIAPDGKAFPCVMARQWQVGNVLETTLASIVHSIALRDIRAIIHETVWLPKRAAGRARDGHAVEGEPGSGDEPQSPDEGENLPECPQSCTPNCGPDVERVEIEIVDPECPQSCTPNCGPDVEGVEIEIVDPECPQSCTPNCGPDVES